MRFQPFDHRSRLDRLRSEAASRGIDAVMLSVGSDLPYFTGYEAMPSERLTMLVVPVDGDPTLFVPVLEAPRVESDVVEVLAWEETDDPVALVASRAAGARRVAIGDHTWSVFLIRLQALLPASEWIPASELTSTMRRRKEPAELERLRAAGEGVDRVVARIPEELAFGGRSEQEVAGDLMRMVVEEGHDVASFAIVGSGPNSASPHHDASDRVIQPGDLVVCDFGGRVDGYFSDLTRTFVVGQPDAEQSEVHDLVARANQAARAAVAPGVPCEEVDRAARRVITEAGFGEAFLHRTGHGIGLEVHEHPYIVEGNPLPLEPGMTFSIEPGVYLEGSMGVRIEDIVACGSDGVEEFNRAPRRLVEVS